MAAALECWSSRANTDEDMSEQVLMKTQDRSEEDIDVSSTSFSNGVGKESSSLMHKKIQKLSRNVSEAITNLKNSLNLDSIRDPPLMKIQTSRKLIWGNVIRNLTRLYPGSQLPEKLVSNIIKHFDSLPISYALAGFDMEDIFLHIRLIEQAMVDEHPAIFIEEIASHGSVFKLTFACNSLISWSAMSGTLDSVSICCKKIQIFEKKGFTLGIILVIIQSGQEQFFKTRVENALVSAFRRPKPMKLPFGLCGRQEENNGYRELGATNDVYDEVDCENVIEDSNPKVQIQIPLPNSSIVVSVDECQTISSGYDEIEKWLLDSSHIEFMDQIGPYSYKGVYKGKQVMIEKVKGCGKGSSYEFELRRDLLELMSFGHKNILHFYGVSIDDNHGLCIVTKMMEGGSVYEIIQKKKKLQTKEIIRIGIDVATGIKFMNDHGLSYRDFNTHRIILDRKGNARLGNMGIITVCKNTGDVMEYETDGFRWLAPEIIAGDPESVSETWMSNVYSFGMVVWEMVTGEAAYSSYSPVQAAVGIAACGLRPDIPEDCPQSLKSLMMKCWKNCPSDRPTFSEILALLQKSKYSGRGL